MEVKARDFDREVLEPGRPALVDFWGSWCIPCKQMDPILEAVAEKQPDLPVFDVNVNRNPSLAAKYRIRGVPTLILFQNGEERGRAVGAQTAGQVLKFIEDHLG